MAQLIIPILYILAGVAALAVLQILRAHNAPLSDPIFSSSSNQSFDIAIGHFKEFTDRAKSTFMYRFVASLSTDEAKKLQRYLTKIHQL
jgi:hypothetical protein